MEFNFDFEGGVHFHLFSHVDDVTPSCLMLVGGFNSFKNRKQRLKKYESNWIISPGRGANEKYLKPPPSMVLHLDFACCLSETLN